MNKRIWLITGVSSGLGEALATTVMACGDFVIGTLRKASQVQAFNAENTEKGKAYLLDITDEQAIEEMIEDIKENFGSIDVLVNNAGRGFIGAVEEASMEEVRSLFEPNFFGALKMTQMVLPIMRENRTGHIVQISSHGGIKAFAGFGIYNATKFALEGFSEALAQEVAPMGIRVSIVQPGPFRTRFADQGLGEAAAVIEDYGETAGAFRQKLKSVNGEQEGDPAKASLAIIDLVNAAEPTLRLPLGKTAVMTIGMKLDSVRADLETHKKTAESSVYQ